MNEVKPIRRRSRERVNRISEQRVNDKKLQSQYQPYKDAAWGFINHWYPALFSEELAEGAVEGIQICGIPIVLRRVNGKVYALKDRCVHRGGSHRQNRPLPIRARSAVARVRFRKRQLPRTS